MNLTKEERQREEFRKILFELAKSQEFFREKHNRYEMYKRLEQLYNEDGNGKRFRHFYSDIFMVLQQIHDGLVEGDITVLGQNLSWIRANYQAQNTNEDGAIIDVSDAIKKLYDHVNLDIARLSYSDAEERKIVGSASIKGIKNKIIELQLKEEKIESVMEETQEELRNSQKEYIAILGIFSAVVISFTGGMAFSTSVLNNIAQTSIYRLVFTILLIGFVLLNSLYGLFFFINTIVKTRRDKGNRLMIYTFRISNLIIVTLLLFTMVSWKAGVVEKRNQRIQQKSVAIEKTEAQSPT